MKFRLVEGGWRNSSSCSSSSGRRLVLFYRAMPVYSGAAPAGTVRRDAGMARRLRRAAYLRRQSMDDAARALGYLHASERLYQMEIQRRVGQGRIAEMPAPTCSASTGSSARSASTGSRNQLRRAVAAGAGAAPGLCGRRQRLPRHAMERAAAGIPAPRRHARALEAGRFAGLGQADGLQLSHNYKIEELRARSSRRSSPPEKARLDFPDAAPDAPITTAPESPIPITPASTSGRLGALVAVRPRRLERMGRRGLAHGDRQADPRQRSASRDRRADPLVSGAHRHAGRLGQGRDDARNAGRAARPERPHRLGLHHRRHRHAGSVRRDARSRPMPSKI